MNSDKTCGRKCEQRRELVQRIQDEDGCTVRDFFLQKGPIGKRLLSIQEPFTSIQWLKRDVVDGQAAPQPSGLNKYTSKLISGILALDIHPRHALNYILHDAANPKFTNVSAALTRAAGEALRRPLMGKGPIVYWVEGTPPVHVMNQFVQQVLANHNISTEEASLDVWYYNTRRFSSCIGQSIWVVLNADKVLSYEDLCCLLANRGFAVRVPHGPEAEMFVRILVLQQSTRTLTPDPSNELSRVFIYTPHERKMKNDTERHFYTEELRRLKKKC